MKCWQAGADTAGRRVVKKNHWDYEMLQFSYGGPVKASGRSCCSHFGVERTRVAQMRLSVKSDSLRWPDHPEMFKLRSTHQLHHAKEPFKVLLTASQSLMHTVIMHISEV